MYGIPLLLLALVLPLNAQTVSTSLAKHRARSRPQTIVRRDSKAKPAYLWDWIDRIENTDDPDHDSALVSMEQRGFDPGFVDPDLTQSLLRLADRYPDGQAPRQVMAVLSLMHPVDPSLRQARAARLAREEQNYAQDEVESAFRAADESTAGELELILRGLTLELNKHQHSLGEWIHLGHLASAWTKQGQYIPQRLVAPLVNVLQTDATGAAFDDIVSVNFAKKNIASVLDRVEPSQSSFADLLNFSDDLIKIRSIDDLQKPDRRLGFMVADQANLAKLALTTLLDANDSLKIRAQIWSALEVSYWKLTKRDFGRLKSTHLSQAECSIFAPHLYKNLWGAKLDGPTPDLDLYVSAPKSIESLAKLISLLRSAAKLRFPNPHLRGIALEILNHAYETHSLAPVFDVLVGEAAHYLKQILPVLPVDLEAFANFLAASQPNLGARLEVAAPWTMHSSLLQNKMIELLDSADNVPVILRTLETSAMSPDHESRVQTWLAKHVELRPVLEGYAPLLVRGDRRRPILAGPTCGDSLLL